MFLPCLCVMIASILSWIWLLCRLRQQSWRRLFPRQLRSLAIAGLLQSVTAVPLDVFGHSSLPTPSVIHAITYDLYRASQLVVALQEAHLALAFFAQCVRWCSALPWLDKSIPAVWAAGIALGIWAALLDMSTPAHGVVSVVTLTCCMGVALLTCFVLVLTTCFSVPSRVRWQSFTRAAGYPIIALACYLPITAANVHEELWSEPGWYRHFAIVCCNMNGVLNVLWAAYALKSCRSCIYPASIRGPGANAMDPDLGRSAPLAERTPGGVADLASFHVLFRGIDVELLDDVSEEPSSPSSGAVQGDAERCTPGFQDGKEPRSEEPRACVPAEKSLAWPDAHKPEDSDADKSTLLGSADALHNSRLRTASTERSLFGSQSRSGSRSPARSRSAEQSVGSLTQAIAELGF